MLDLEAVLVAFHDATRCSAAVWVPKGATGAVEAIARGGEILDPPPNLPELPAQPARGPKDGTLTARLPGPKRAWISVGPCADPQVSAETHLRLLSPIVAQILRGSLEVEHAAEELAERYEEINLLYTISEILGSTTSVEDASRAILVELSQTVGARRASVLVLDRDANVLRPVASIGAEVAELPAIPVNDLGSVAARVFRTRHGAIVDASEVTSDVEAPYVRGSLLSVPILWTRPGASNPLGVVNLADREIGSFTAGDQKLVTAIATQIGTAIQNARLVRASMEQQRLQQEMNLAHDLQMKLLPSTASITDVQVAARVVPAESVGGDFYNLFRLGNAATGVMLGDVSSHGYRAALIMALVMSASAIQAQIHSDPGAMLGALLRSLRDELMSTEMHIGLFYGVLNRKKNQLSYANSGHPHAFVLDGDGKPERLAAIDPPLGLVDVEPSAVSRPWRGKETLLVLFTDGMSDARNANDERFGEQRVLDVIKRNRSEEVQTIVDKVFTSLGRFAGRTPPRDDQTLVVLRT
jgi:sigma-B regulation protein RsbU (phosphoserine phosphatase)